MTDAAPTPKNILRGHKAQIHAAAFIRQNERLATGDADGYVVLWDLTIMRPRAVWKPHEGAILGIRGWGWDKVITHGRDHKLIVWQIRQIDEEPLSVSLPVEELPAPRPCPQKLHLLEVNTMNFCSFAACSAGDEGHGSSSLDAADKIHIAVPHTLASDAIDIYSLPQGSRIHTVRSSKDMGMAMSLALLRLKGCLTLIAAFENGFAAVHRLQDNGDWTLMYRSQAHTQPILSLDVHPSHDFFLTSGADAVLAKHPIPMSQQEVIPDIDPENRIVEEVEVDDDASEPSGPSLLSARLKNSATQKDSIKTVLRHWEHPIKTVNTKHVGQQSLRVRSDGRIFATAGWDSKVRAYSCKTMKELAVLQWHKVGCYAVAFADIPTTPPEEPSRNEANHGSDSGVPTATALTTRTGGSTAVKDRRIQQAKTAHWVAAGAKDGKITLWEIY